MLKQNNLTSALSRTFFLALCSLFPIIGFTQPAEFSIDCNTENSAQLIIFLGINGMPSVVGEDWVGIFDGDGFVIGAGEVRLLEETFGCPDGSGASAAVYGVSNISGLCTDEEMGADRNEFVSVFAWDASEDLFYIVPGDYRYRNSTSMPDPTNNPAFCDQINATELANALPVRLESFRGNALNEKTIGLDWVTAIEDNVSHFEVEQSANGRNWEVIGAVEAAGDSQIAQSYTFVDADVFERNNFYRLRMVDNDGSFRYSGIVIVEMDLSSEKALNVFPNPVIAADNTQFSIQLGGSWSEEQPVTAKLYDGQGRLLKVYDDLVRGTTSLALPLEAKAGMYLLQAAQGATVMHRKLVIY